MTFDQQKLARLLAADDRIEAANRHFLKTLKKVAPIGTRVSARMFSRENREIWVDGTVALYDDNSVRRLVIEVSEKVAEQLRPWERVPNTATMVWVFYCSLRFPVDG